MSRLEVGYTQPPIQCSLEVKQTEHKTDHSSPTRAKVQNVWSYTSTPPYIFMVWCLIKHRDSFTLPYQISTQPLYVTPLQATGVVSWKEIMKWSIIWIHKGALLKFVNMNLEEGSRFHTFKCEEPQCGAFIYKL
jgi:hypothetical protein